VCTAGRGTLTSAKVALTDGFWKLSNAGANRPGTLVPATFDITTAGQKFTVDPNATKHMAEYARSQGTAPSRHHDAVSDCSAHRGRCLQRNHAAAEQRSERLLAERTVVIRNPSAVDGGTAFRPTSGYDYFLNLH
jgi:hypothetical protein